MRNKANQITRRSVLAASVCLLPAAPAADIGVIVRQDLPIESVSFADLRKLLLGDRQFWSSNLRVTLLVRAPGSREREILLKTVYQMSEAQFRQYWIAKVFRAEAPSGPRVVYSNDMAAELATAIPGAMAFVEAPQPPRGLKFLKINGKLPGDRDYPLR